MWIDFIILTASYAISYILSAAALYTASGVLLMACGVFLAFRNFKKFGILDAPAVFSLSWNFCAGVSALKLSSLQKPWNPKTWLVFFLIYFLFTLTYRTVSGRIKLPEKSLKNLNASLRDLSVIIVVLTIVSAASFLIEASVLGFIPLFTSNVPHAYSAFHLKGLHYFTVICVLEPSFFVLWLLSRKGSSKNDLIPFFCTTVCVLLPVLMVSRFQMIFGILLSLITFIVKKNSEMKKYINRRNLIISVTGLVLMVCAYIFITIERAHSVEYLNGIFSMKNPDTPIAVTQPYMYIANNFDNFNCLVNELTEHSHGFRQAYPFFTLSGIKFFTELPLAYPLYTTKEELTTLTMFYDAYYDFGIIGCAGLSAILGFIFSVLRTIPEKINRPGLLLITSQMYAYLLLAFFTTWFSNPTTWFYFAVSVAIDMILWYSKKDLNKKGENDP